MGGDDVVLEVRRISKQYGGLRPLRMEHLKVRRGESVAIVGVDLPAAQVLVDLLTGASAPDTGDVMVFGQPTEAIADGDAWLTFLDHFGILSARAVLLDALTVEQNLAVPFSLQLNPIPEDVRAQLAMLASEVGLAPGVLSRPVSATTPDVRLRVRLARAVALRPHLLLAEHPNALAEAAVLSTFAADFRALVAARGLTSLTLTADESYAASVATRVLTLAPATGVLGEKTGWKDRLGRWGR